MAGAGFRWAGDLNGQKNPIVRELQIPTATAVEKGEPIQFTPGTGVIVHAAPTNMVLGIAGVAMEAHDGATTTGRHKGLKLEVSTSPTAIYSHKASKAYTLTGGSASIATIATLVTDTANVWKGGSIKIMTCAANSALIGRVVKIASHATSGVLTLAETLESALASGDTVMLCPGPFAYGSFWSLNSDAMAPDYVQSNQGKVCKLVGSNPETLETQWFFESRLVIS
jgi:hypothetical protein